MATTRSEPGGVWGRLVTGSLKARLLLALKVVIGALTIGGALAAFAKLYGWPDVLRFSGAVVGSAVGLFWIYLHRRAFVVIREEAERADQAERRALWWERDFMALQRQITGTFKVLDTLIKHDETEAVNLMRKEVAEINGRLDRIVASFDANLPEDPRFPKSS